MRKKHLEVEAKFFVPNRNTFDQLCRVQQLAGYRIRMAGVKRVWDRYLDTADRAILRAGYACRIRQRMGEQGPGLVTLKGLDRGQGERGLHRREEYETQVRHDDPQRWPESLVRRKVLQLSAGQPLVKLFALGQERHVRLLEKCVSREWMPVAELSLDVVRFDQKRALPPSSCAEGGRVWKKAFAMPSSERHYELEIELLDQGRESDLCMLIEVLLKDWNLKSESRSKFERGLARRGYARCARRCWDN